MKKITNARNETLHVSEHQFAELLNMGVVEIDGTWLEIEYDGHFPCWDFLAIGLDQLPGEIMIDVELDKREIH